MYRFFKLLIAEVLLLLLVIPSSYAIELIGFKANMPMEKDPERINLFEVSDIESSRSLRIDAGKDGNRHINAVSDVTLRSYISHQNVPQSIVNDITIDFSTGKNSKSFDMDFPSGAGDVMLIGSAFMTNLVMHEFGHAIVAEQAGASGNNVGFFKQQGGSFFLGTSTVSHIEPESRLPYVMGGEFFADLTFEQALKEYRKSPSVYNKSLLLFSGTDFLLYCIYAFSMDSENSSYDPVTISRETGISKEALISVALAKTILNAYRVHSGEDRVVPYFTVDNHSAVLNLGIPF